MENTRHHPKRYYLLYSGGLFSTMLFLCGEKWHRLLCDYQSGMVRENAVLDNFYLVPRGIKRDLRIELDQVLGVELNLWWRSSGSIRVYEDVISGGPLSWLSRGQLFRFLFRALLLLSS